MRSLLVTANLDEIPFWWDKLGLFEHLEARENLICLGQRNNKISELIKELNWETESTVAYAVELLNRELEDQLPC